MRIYVPQTTLVLTESNVAESTLPAWSASTTYAAEAKVRHTLSGDWIVREYASLQKDNLNHPPTDGGNAWWADLGPANRYEMFDGRNNTRTVSDASDGEIMVKISPPGRAMSLAILGLRNCTLVNIKMWASCGSSQQVYGKTISMYSIAEPVGWWAWLFAKRDFLVRRSIIVDLPGMLLRPCVQVRLSGGLVECGQCFFCEPYDLGDVADGASPSLISYSTFSPDQFGVVTYVPRQNTRELSCTLWIPTEDFNRVYAILETTESSLVLVDANHQGDGATDIDALRVYGKITQARPGLAYERTPIDLRIQGLD